MKNRSQWFWALIGLALAASNGWAFINPIAISNTQPLAFGKFAAGSGGSVTVSAAGARSAGGGVVLVSSVSSAAQFSVSGDPNLTYSITLPANGAVVLSSGANTMALSNFSSSPSVGQLSAGGTQTLTVGATLTVGSSQATGSYSGSFDVTVNYN
jgi:hypothetical protein